MIGTLKGLYYGIIWIMNWTSIKFIVGFISILVVSLVVLVYFSGEGDFKKDINSEDNLAEEQVLE